MKLLITGVHATPAVALIDAFADCPIKEKPEIVYVGRKYAVSGEKTISLEYKEITKRKIRFVNLEASRLARFLSIKTLINIFKLPIGFVKAFCIIKKEKPDIILSFGGYIALPVCFAGFFNRVPVYVHEQTVNPGLTNKIVALFAKTIFCSFEENLKQFPKNKTLLTGNPIRKSVFAPVKKPFILNKDRPVIYVTGGSLGSHSINLLIKEIIIRLLDKYIVIHQTGETEEYQDFESLTCFRESMEDSKKNNYFLAKHFFDDEIGYIYNQADLVIGRAGANTYFELLALAKPALFIPLPWSASGEQQEHANLFTKMGTGEIFAQDNSSQELLVLVDKMIDNLDFYKRNFIQSKFLIQKNASQIIIQKILRC